MRDGLSKAEWTARLVEWNPEKGYGWLQWGDKRVFLHRREMDGASRVLRIGEEIRFILGQDERGRPCATDAVPVRKSVRIGGLSLLLLAALLILPAVALHRVPIEAWKTALYVLTVSLMTYTAYASDKRRARTNAWRIPEAHLHLLELLGGWPGAWLAQQRLRHKCSKNRYQFVFWSIILIHQFIAFDSLQDWHFSKLMMKNE